MSDQKYRQRGYQDQGRTERDKPGPSQGPGSRPLPQPGPRGRGLGMPTATVFRCGSCGNLHELAYVVQGATCGKCRSDLHCCKNCKHFDTGTHNECRQGVPVRIPVKTRGNDCALFTAQLKQEQQQEVGGQRDARSAFDALFKF